LGDGIERDGVLYTPAFRGRNYISVYNISAKGHRYRFLAYDVSHQSVIIF
jgi:hypothetical protein